MDGRVRRYREPRPKPCPFCGQVPTIHKHFVDLMWSLIHRCEILGLIRFDWTGNKAALIRRWNTRHEG